MNIHKTFNTTKPLNPSSNTNFPWLLVGSLRSLWITNLGNDTGNVHKTYLKKIVFVFCNFRSITALCSAVQHSYNQQCWTLHNSLTNRILQYKPLSDGMLLLSCKRLPFFICIWIFLFNRIFQIMADWEPTWIFHNNCLCV